MNSLPNTSFLLSRTPVTPDMVISTSVPEPDPGAGESEWSAEASYEAGAIVVRSHLHRCFERVITGSSTTPPETDETHWLSLGPSNAWNMWDLKIGTRTIQHDGQTLRVRLQPQQVTEGIGLFELQGVQARLLIHESAAEDAPLIAQRSWDLDAALIDDWYDYFYAADAQRRIAIAIDLPGEFTDAVLTLEIDPQPGGKAAIGSMELGRVYGIGSIEFGAGAGLISWGHVNQDAFGNREWLPGEWSYRVEGRLVAHARELSRMHRLFARHLNVPAVYVLTQQEGLEPLVVLGVTTAYKGQIDNAKRMSAPITIESLNHNNDDL